MEADRSQSSSAEKHPSGQNGNRSPNHAGSSRVTGKEVDGGGIEAALHPTLHPALRQGPKLIPSTES